MKYSRHLRRGLPWAFGYIASTNLIHLLRIRDYSNFLWDAFEFAVCVLIAGPLYSLLASKFSGNAKHRSDENETAKEKT